PSGWDPSARIARTAPAAGRSISLRFPDRRRPPHGGATRGRAPSGQEAAREGGPTDVDLDRPHARNPPYFGAAGRRRALSRGGRGRPSDCCEPSLRQDAELAKNRRGVEVDALANELLAAETEDRDHRAAEFLPRRRDAAELAA